MKTIGKHRPHWSPRGDRIVMCSYCGVSWRLSQMIVDSDGNYACPDDFGGRTHNDLADAIHDSAQAMPERIDPLDGGPRDTFNADGSSVHNTDFT